MKATCSIALLACLLAGSSAIVSAQTSSNLCLKVKNISASVNADALSNLNDNRYSGSAKYWSSYTDDGHLGELAYVELEWEQQNIYNEVRAYWASDEANVLLPTEAYVSWWDGSDWQQGSTLTPADDKGVSRTEVAVTAWHRAPQ